MFGESAEVHLVHHRTRRTDVQRTIPFPIVASRVDDDAFHGGRRVVAFFGGGVTAEALGHDDTAPVGIEQDFLWIEALTVRRIERSQGSVSVDLTRSHLRNKGVPVGMLAIRHRVDRDHSCRSSIVYAIE